ncbi:hypothetical protein [Streptomyces sp. C10-9-1]|uniref:hypothetical protein n=1 Tax=Streptomyces sp. C10-9-1 TaxID=1859285 RepID=UPI003D7034F4
MPGQLFPPERADPDYDDQGPKAGPREAIDLTALGALPESRANVEVLDLAAERPRHLGDAFTAAGGRACGRRRSPRPVRNYLNT